jgi:hypothetical protein
MNPGIRDHSFTRFARYTAKVMLRNTLAFPPTNKNISISPHSAKLPTSGLKVQGYINEAALFVF